MHIRRVYRRTTTKGCFGAIRPPDQRKYDSRSRADEKIFEYVAPPQHTILKSYS